MMKIRNLLLFILGGILILSVLMSCKRPTLHLLVIQDTEAIESRWNTSLAKQADKLGFEVSKAPLAGALKEERLKDISVCVLGEVDVNQLTPQQMRILQRYVEAGGTIIGMDNVPPDAYRWPWLNQLYDEFDHRVDSVNHQVAHKKIAVGRGYWIQLQDHTSTSSYASDTGDHKNIWKEILKTHIEYLGVPNYQYATSPPRPDETQFQMVRLAATLNEPIELAVTPQSDVFIIERKGGIKYYDAKADSLLQIAQLHVITSQSNGLNGIALDPDYASNHHVFLSYSPLRDTLHHYISRFTFDTKSQNLLDENVIMQIPMDYQTAWHGQNSIEFDTDGLLYIGMGDFTLQSPDISGYAQIDERPEHYRTDAQRTAANSKSHMGKILRIRPLAEGGYTIPDDNLFAQDTSLGLPEIYVMGCRNPYRFSIDPQTHNLFFGDVGPDAVVAGPKGPQGHDEINLVQRAGFYGWPYVVADNRPYRNVDYQTGEIGEAFSPQKIFNRSPNNTGIKALPPAQPPIIWYPKGSQSNIFPHMGDGGINVMVGPVYRKELYQSNPHQFPDYFDGKLFIYDWVRSWINIVTLDEVAKPLAIEPFLPHAIFSKPIDMEFGPKGVLYVLEYGNKGYVNNPEAQLTQIIFQPASDIPQFDLDQSILAGGAPLTVSLNATPSQLSVSGEDFTYKWKIGKKTYEGQHITLDLVKPGIYQPVLTVSNGKQQTQYIGQDITVGNHVPVINIVSNSNTSFYWDKAEWDYQIEISDEEDGSTLSGSIPWKDVQIDYTYEPAHISEATGAQKPATDAWSLIEQNPCVACHHRVDAGVGPSFTAIAQRYHGQVAAKAQLVTKVIKGGVGNWGGNIAMPAHPHLTREEAHLMVEYILEQVASAPATATYSSKGTVTLNQHIPHNHGEYLFKVTYTDKGSGIAPPITASQAIKLRPAYLKPDACDSALGIDFDPHSGQAIMVADTAFLYFEAVDLKHISQITIIGEQVYSDMQVKIFTDKGGRNSLGDYNIQTNKDGAFRASIPIEETDRKVNLFVQFMSEEKFLDASILRMRIHAIHFEKS